MAVAIEGIPPPPTPRDNRRFDTKLIVKVIAMMTVACMAMALVVVAMTGRSQQHLLAQQNAAAECRAEKAIKEAGASDQAVILLLQSIVALGNRQPLDFQAIASAAGELKVAAAARSNSVHDCK